VFRNEKWGGKPVCSKWFNTEKNVTYKRLLGNISTQLDVNGEMKSAGYMPSRIQQKRM
jgi:hypothetical protein